MQPLPSRPIILATSPLYQDDMRSSLLRISDERLSSASGPLLSLTGLVSGRNIGYYNAARGLFQTRLRYPIIAGFVHNRSADNRQLTTDAFMPAVNPEILVWARETAGMSQGEAARKIVLHDSRNVTATDKLAAMERGQKEPSRSVLSRMARQYRRPLITFYMSGPPRKGDRGADFRTLDQEQFDTHHHLVDALVREVRSRQSMVRAVMEAEREAKRLPFVGKMQGIDLLSVHTSDAIDAICQEFNLELPAQYYSQPNANNAFGLLRSKAEAAGVFVLLKGNLGSYHTNLPVDVFRGFVISDRIAPFVVINSQDPPSAQSFTLLHELVHLLLGDTGISGNIGGTDREMFCNSAASECLLPSVELVRLISGRNRV